jgi:hypothetical protein
MLGQEAAYQPAVLVLPVVDHSTGSAPTAVQPGGTGSPGVVGWPRASGGIRQTSSGIGQTSSGIGQTSSGIGQTSCGIGQIRVGQVGIRDG